MDVLIVGCGKVGQKLAEQLVLEDDMNITVVDTRADVVQNIINRHDIMGVVGNGSDLDVMMEAGVETADLLIAVTGSDELNLLACLLAKKIGDCQTIARVRKPEYSKCIKHLKEDLGLALVINPEQTAANEMARLLRFPSAINIDTFAKGRIEMLRLRIAENSVLDNMMVMNLSRELGCDILICGVERGDSAFIPKGNFVLKSGDRISVVASAKNASFFFKKIGVKTNSVKDTMIVGGGDTAFYLASNLMQTGISVKIIESNPERCSQLCELLPKASIINADGTENSLLLEEGLEYAQSFVALTNIDEENILLSLFAKSKSSAKVITKVNRIAYDEVISRLDLDSVIYPKNITAEYIVKFVRAVKNSIGSNLETMHVILDGKGEALEFNIKENSPVSNIPIEKLALRDDVLIACINRNGRVFTPRGQDIIKNKDTVIVVTTKTGLKDISDILA